MSKDVSLLITYDVFDVAETWLQEAPGSLQDDYRNDQKHPEMFSALPSKSAQRISTPLRFGDSQSSQVFWHITEDTVTAVMQTLFLSPTSAEESIIQR